MVEVVITFSEDKNDTPKAVPRYHYQINQGIFGSGLRDSGMYDRIMQYTNNHRLAVDVEGWAETSAIGDIYESDELTAEIIEV